MKTLRLFAVASIAALPGAIAAKDENDDPLISGFPGFATWYRSHGGTRKRVFVSVFTYIILLVDALKNSLIFFNCVLSR